MIMRELNTFNDAKQPDNFDWSFISQFINGNVTKFSLEVQGIKAKLLSLETDYREHINPFAWRQFEQLRAIYFPDE